MLAASHRNIFVVGDDDQSIYGWRGADANNLLKFRTDFPDAEVFKLEQNYRSTKKILDAANKIISLNENRFQKTLWTQNEDGVRVETYTAYSENEEAAYVVQQISNLVSFGKYTYSDFAVLMRINALSRVFEQEFLKYGIPFKVFGGFKFFERKDFGQRKRRRGVVQDYQHAASRDWRHDGGEVETLCVRQQYKYA